jgi:putative oxidoreductase
MKPIHLSATVWLRWALAAGFLSAVASRLGWLGAHSSGWSAFIEYTAQVNSFLPQAFIPAVAIASTALETTLGLLLLAGVRTSLAARFAAVLTLLFGLAMTYSFGIKEPLDYSVFAFSAGAWLLSGIQHYPYSIDQLFIHKKNNNENNR